MDMNQLFHHHQIALMTANHARQMGRPPGGFDLAHHYVTLINHFRESRGLLPDFAGYAGHAPGVG
jgi:hypothetical protein